MAADGKTPPTHPQGGGAGTLCVHVVSLCADTKTMTCRPCLDTYIHTYKQTINQYKQIAIIHKSIETYSYTYTWLQMVRPPQPTHRGGGGNIMCTCSIFVCRHKNNDMSTLLGHAHTYIPTDRQTDTQAYIHKSIQTYSYTYTRLHMCDVSPLWGGVGGNQGGLDHIYYTSSVFSHQLFQASFPISPGICMKTLPKKPIVPNHTTSKSVRTPSFKEAMKSAARPLLLPPKPTAALHPNLPRSFCVRWTSGKAVFFLVFKNTQRFCFTKKNGKHVILQGSVFFFGG